MILIRSQITLSNAVCALVDSFILLRILYSVMEDYKPPPLYYGPPSPPSYRYASLPPPPPPPPPPPQPVREVREVVYRKPVEPHFVRYEGYVPRSEPRGAVEKIYRG